MSVEDVLRQLITQGMPKSEDQRQQLLDQLGGKEQKEEEPTPQAPSGRSSRS